MDKCECLFVADGRKRPCLSDEKEYLGNCGEILRTVDSVGLGLCGCQWCIEELKRYRQRLVTPWALRMVPLFDERLAACRRADATGE